MYNCTNCWNESVKWQGQCDFCKEWNSLKEFKEAKNVDKVEKWEVKTLSKISNSKLKENRIISKSGEFNNLMWGWIVEWSVVLLSWEPWIWKSTITLWLWNWIEESIVYISWEETEWQLYDRANRLNIKNEKLSILSESNIENILETLKNNPSKIVIIDSISVMHSSNINWTSGSISQVKYITELLVAFAKTTNTTVFLIGHITKDWNLAWPKTLEHMVDVVLYFEWDKYDNLRILRALKNRFWTTSEIGIFKMDEKWINDLKNPWLEFINAWENSIWSSLSITVEWTRPIVVETESLTTYTKFWYPKRSTRWVNSSKLDLIIAVLLKYSSVKLDSHDVYSNISRGLKIDEPWIDLSLCASIISSKTNKIIPKDTIFIWEISLTWNIRTVMHMEKRIKEASKLWFKNIIVPKVKLKWKYDINVIEVWDVKELVGKI